MQCCDWAFIDGAAGGWRRVSQDGGTVERSCNSIAVQGQSVGFVDVPSRLYPKAGVTATGGKKMDQWRGELHSAPRSRSQ